MSWEVMEANQGLSKYADDWQRLNCVLFQSHPLFDIRYVNLLLKYFSSGKEKLCIHRNEDGIVNGLLLLVPKKFGTWSVYLPSQAQISPVLVMDSSCLMTLFSALPGLVLILELLNQDTRYSILSGDTKHIPVYKQENVTTIGVELIGEFDDYWKARSKNLKQNIKRYRNRIKREGIEVRFTSICPSESCEYVKAYGELESSGWKGKENTAIHIDNSQGKFYTELLDSYAKTNEALICELFNGEKLIASRLCVKNGAMLVVLKTTYDESSACYAPGRILLQSILMQQFEVKHVAVVEFYTNATKEQISWSTTQRKIEHITLFRNYFLNNCYRLFKSIRTLFNE